MSKPIWVRWYPKDALDGMQQLSVAEELGYRRVLDLIFVTGDNLHDDDRALAWSTKLGRAWPAVKQKLLVQGKLLIDQGFIRNSRASKVCAETASFIAQRSAAGRGSSANKRNRLKPQEIQEIAPTTDDLPFEREELSRLNGRANETRTNQQSTIRKKDISSKRRSKAAIATGKIPPEGFAEWWAAYPKKEAKLEAEEAYKKALSRGASVAELLTGLHRAQWNPDRQFIPLPTTWLNQGRWLDEPQPPPASHASELRGGL